MKLVFAIFALWANFSLFEAQQRKIVCYYDNRSFFRDGLGKFRLADIEPALSLCTHVVYGYAAINRDTSKLVPSIENYDVSNNNYKYFTEWKQTYPGIKMLLSVGGFADDQNPEKYLTLLEKAETRNIFIASAKQLLKAYGFDGLDLAWQFPTIKAKKTRGTFSAAWHGFKKLFSGDSKDDDKAEMHRDQFTSFVREIKNSLSDDNYVLTASVLPNVNSTVYFDARKIISYLDQVHLMAYDFYTPERNPNLADYPSPLYDLIDRNPEFNANYQVRKWIEAGVPANKIVLGVPTYGRTWKMSKESGTSGVPPITADGPGESSNSTNEPGLLSYAEICNRITISKSDGKSRKIRATADAPKKHELKRLNSYDDLSKRYGIYAFHLPDEKGNGGMWVGYEDPEIAGNKAAFARAKGLAGIAVMDITLDDFKGLCDNDKYPILTAVKNRL